MPNFTRAAFVAAVTAAALAPGAVSAQGLVNVRVAGTAARDVLGALWAEKSGMFQKLGLDVDIQSLRSGAAVSAAVVGGSFDIGKSSLFGLITAFAKGVPFVVVAPAAIWETDVPNSAMFVAKDSPIRTGRDLNGKTVGVSALGDLFTVANSAWIDQSGGDARTVKFLELPDSAAAQAISTGRIDAASFAEPLYSGLLKNDKFRMIGYPMDAIAKQFIASAYFCTKDFALKHADMLTRFRNGVYQGVAYSEAHRSEMIPVIANYSKVDESVVAAMSKAPLGTATFMSPRMIQPMIAAAVKYKIIPASFPAESMMDPSALRA